MSKSNIYWSLSLFGTAIGAGVLFLPITVGVGGVISVFIMALLAYPLTHYAHKLLSKFIFQSDGTNDFTKAVDSDFGSKVGFFLTIVYFLEIYIVLLLYAVAITNTLDLILTSNLGFEQSHRVLLSAGMVAFLMLIISRGVDTIIKVISYFVFIFIFSMVVLSLYMIQYWDGGIFTHFNIASVKAKDILISSLYAIPVMIFAFNHFAILSAMVIAQKKEDRVNAESNIDKILKSSHIIIVLVALFFVFSCAMSFTTEQFNEANKQNINILSYIATQHEGSVLHIVAPLIAALAIMKSFLGHYMGTKEGFIGIIRRADFTKRFSNKALNRITFIFIGLSCFVVAVLNPSVLDMINKFIAPLIAIILFLLPVYAVRTMPKMKKYMSLSVYFVGFVGFLALGVIVLEFFNIF